MKCDNCEKKADYTCADPGASPVNYCATCLPTWLRDRAARGDFPLQGEAPVKKSSKKEPKEETKVVEEE